MILVSKEVLDDGSTSTIIVEGLERVIFEDKTIYLTVHNETESFNIKEHPKYIQIVE